jgi:hypothetical protein
MQDCYIFLTNKGFNLEAINIYSLYKVAQNKYQNCSKKKNKPNVNHSSSLVRLDFIFSEIAPRLCALLVTPWVRKTTAILFQLEDDLNTLAYGRRPLNILAK